MATLTYLFNLWGLLHLSSLHLICLLFQTLDHRIRQTFQAVDPMP